VTRLAKRSARRPVDWRTRIARAALITLVPFTLVVQVAFAHSAPVVQTIRSGETLTAFSGTFEVVWRSQVLIAGAEIELRDALTSPNEVLMRAVEEAAVEENVLCPGLSITYTCTRIRLTDIPALVPGSYVMYWRVVHFDEYIEQRVVRFDIDPNWVSPTPTSTASSSPTPTPSATATPSTTPSATPAPTLGPSSTPSDTPAPSIASPDSSPSAAPEDSPPGQLTPSPSGGATEGEESPLSTPVIAAGAALLLMTGAALGFTWWRRAGRATSPRKD